MIVHQNTDQVENVDFELEIGKVQHLSLHNNIPLSVDKYIGFQR